MRIVVTGQVGLDKKPFLERAAAIARDRGCEPTVCHVGDRMYAEAPDVAPGKILDLPLSRLQSLRRSVFKDVLVACAKGGDVLVNTHATFRWRHGLFYAFDYDQMKALGADLYLTLVDSVDRVHHRLVRDGHTDHTLKDLMVWREEEILATELLSQIVTGHGRFLILARGGEGDDGPCAGAAMLARFFDRPQPKKAYLSFPMTHVRDSPALLAEIEGFRREMKRHLICFDPGDLEETNLARLAIDAAAEGRRFVEVGPPGARSVMETHDLLGILADIDGQIYARDFKLIDQADMIVSLIPEREDGRAALSSGVERELQHAHEATRDTFVIWRPKIHPSPFITETATKVFRSVPEAVGFFLDRHFIPPPPAGALFA